VAVHGAGQPHVAPTFAELLAVALLAVGLLVVDPGARPGRLSFASLYSLAVAARKNQCWSQAALALLHSARKVQTQQLRREGRR
jgi:hypothetical protein